MSHTSPILPAAPDASACAHQSAFEILSTCHEHIGERLAVLETVGRELGSGVEFGESQLARLGDVLAFLDTAIPIHSADEEQSLFPRLRTRPPFAGVEGTPMDCMEAEHQEHTALRARLKAAVVKRDVPAVSRAALAIASEYRSHIAKEEDILYPMAREVLTDPAEIEAMTGEMRTRRKEAGLLGC